MTSAGKAGSSDLIVTVHVPLVIRKKGGRKLVLAPEGAPVAVQRARVDNTLVKALARAFRWRRLIETGVYATVGDIAAAEKMNDSYVSRVLRLTLLAPDLIEGILNGRHSTSLRLGALLKPFEMEWNQQWADFALTSGTSRCV